MTNSIKCKTRFYRLFPSTGYLGYGFEEYEAEYDRSAFLVIDVYGLGFHPDDPVPAYNKDGHASGGAPCPGLAEEFRARRPHHQDRPAACLERCQSNQPPGYLSQ